MRDGRIDGMNPWPIALVIVLWLWAAIYFAGRVIA